MPSAPLHVAVVCKNNMNRSMEAHSMLQRKGFSVRSFGVSSYLKLSGPIHDLPLSYTFATTYQQIYEDLLGTDPERYAQNGLLHLLGRNARVKARPERFQDCSECFDIIFTCEEKVFHKVVKKLSSREQATSQPVHVINVDMEDTQEGAILGAVRIVQLCQRLQSADDLESGVCQVLQDTEKETGERFLHTVCFY